MKCDLEKTNYYKIDKQANHYCFRLNRRPSTSSLAVLIVITTSVREAKIAFNPFNVVPWSFCPNK